MQGRRKRGRRKGDRSPLEGSIKNGRFYETYVRDLGSHQNASVRHWCLQVFEVSQTLSRRIGYLGGLLVVA